MNAVEPDLRTELLERLERSARLLFDMEERGEQGPEYERWLAGWLRLLDQYEASGA